jgi:hypothetical protein
MSCTYHDNVDAIRCCVRCNKAICNECTHSIFIEYCWSCGLDYDNELEEAGKSFKFPKIFENRIIFYILHKLFSAFGACLIFTLLLSILSSAFGFNELITPAVYIWLITAAIVFTYGIIVSMAIDFLLRIFEWLRKWYITLGLYLLCGYTLPFIVDLSVGNNQFISVFGGIVSSIFFGLQKIIISRNLIISIGLFSLIPLFIMLLISVISI